MTKLFMTTFLGLMFGFFLGVSLPTLFISEMNLPSGLLPSFDITYMEDKYSALSPHALLNAFSSLRGHSSKSLLYHKHNGTKIRGNDNPLGAERLPPGIVAAESDLYPRRLWGVPDEDLAMRQKYLVTFTVGYHQKNNIKGQTNLKYI